MPSCHLGKAHSPPAGGMLPYPTSPQGKALGSSRGPPALPRWSLWRLGCLPSAWIITAEQGFSNIFYPQSPLSPRKLPWKPRMWNGYKWRQWSGGHGRRTWSVAPPQSSSCSLPSSKQQVLKGLMGPLGLNHMVCRHCLSEHIPVPGQDPELSILPGIDLQLKTITFLWLSCDYNLTNKDGMLENTHFPSPMKGNTAT